MNINLQSIRMASIAAFPLLMFQMELAANITSDMDNTVDPCVDFYKFACGDYMNWTGIPEGRNLINRNVEADIANWNELRALFEEADLPDDPLSTLMVKRFYRSCINVDNLEKLGLDPLKALLDKYGGWPVVKGEAWNADGYDWMKTNALLVTTQSGDKILNFRIDPDFKNSTKKILVIDQPKMVQGDRAMYVDSRNKATLDAYLDYMVATAIQHGASPAAAKKEMEDVWKLEIDLAAILTPATQRETLEDLYHPATIKALKLKYPKINFDIWFKTVGEAGWNFTDCDEVDVNGLLYLEQLTDTLARYSPRTLANYQIWTIMALNYNYFIAPSLQVNLLKYSTALTGKKSPKPRADECYSQTIQLLSSPVGAMYVKKFFSPETKIEADSLATKIRQAVSDTINSTAWMDDETKVKAQLKLPKLTQYIGFPVPQIYDENWVLRDLAKAQISEKTFLENVVSVRSSNRDRQIRKYWDPIDQRVWSGAELIKSTYSTSLERYSFTVTAGALRLPWYDARAPDYFNFGRIGSVIGMLVAEGIGFNGRMYDGDGNNVVDWFSNSTGAEFDKRSQCFVEQYSNITDTLTGIRLNGQRSLNYNLANNIGIKLAYKAFKASQQDPSIASSDRNKILADVGNYTAEQLFFLSSAQGSCSLVRKEWQSVLVTKYSQPSSDSQVNVALQNSDEFAAAFSCPLGSPMNPVKKCQMY